MFKELFKGSLLMDLPVLSMLFFLAVFVGIIAWAVLRGRHGHFEAVSGLPLDDGEVNSHEC